MGILKKKHTAVESDQQPQLNVTRHDAFVRFFRKFSNADKLESTVKLLIEIRDNKKSVLRNWNKNSDKFPAATQAFYNLTKLTHEPPKDLTVQKELVRSLKIISALFPELESSSFGHIDETNPLFKEVTDAQVELERYFGDKKKFLEQSKGEDLKVYALGMNGNHDFIFPATRDLCSGKPKLKDMFEILDKWKNDPTVAVLITEHIVSTGKIDDVERLFETARFHPLKTTILERMAEGMKALGENYDTMGAEPSAPKHMIIYSLKDLYGEVDSDVIKKHIGEVKSQVYDIRARVRSIQEEIVDHVYETDLSQRLSQDLVEMSNQDQLSLFVIHELLDALKGTIYFGDTSGLMSLLGPFASLNELEKPRSGYDSRIELTVGCKAIDVYKSRVVETHKFIQKVNGLLEKTDEDSLYKLALDNDGFQVQATFVLAKHYKPTSEQMETILKSPGLNDLAARMAVYGLLGTGDTPAIFRVLENLRGKEDTEFGKAMLEQFSKGELVKPNIHLFARQQSGTFSISGMPVVIQIGFPQQSFKLGVREERVPLPLRTKKETEENVLLSIDELIKRVANRALVLNSITPSWLTLEKLSTE